MLFHFKLYMCIYNTIRAIFLSDCHYYCLFVMNKFVGETNFLKTILLNYLRRKNWNERSTYDAQTTLIWPYRNIIGIEKSIYVRTFGFLTNCLQFCITQYLSSRLVICQLYHFASFWYLGLWNTGYLTLSKN